MTKEKSQNLEESKSNQQSETPKKKPKTLLLIIIAVVVLMGGAAGAYFFLIGKEANNDKSTKKNIKEGQSINFALEPFVVNLMDQGGSKYLKVSVQLELANPKLVEQAKNKTPQLRDAIITLLTNKTSEELITPEGKLLLKDEIKQRSSQILGEGTIVNVYLTDFVMQ